MLSIGIPSYRGEDIALGAIMSAKRQIYPNVEVILADDNSPPEIGQRLENLAKAQGVRFIRTGGTGLPGVYNALANAAMYPYVLLLDNDAMISPITANVLLHFFQNNQVGVVGIAANRVTRDTYAVNTFKGVESTGEGRVEMATQLAGYCYAFPKHLWRQYGGFDPHFGYYLADSDFCCVLAKHKIPSYRLHYPKPEHLEHATLEAHTELHSRERLAKDQIAFAKKWGRVAEETQNKLLSKISPRTIQHVYANRVLRTQVSWR